MKNKAGKMMLLTGVMCMLSLSLCACGGEKEPPKVSEQQEDLEGETPEEDSGSGTDTDTNSQEPPEEQDDSSAKWDDSDPDLEGDIKELEDGQFTVVEAITETLENGEAIMIMSAEGEDDSEFNKVTIAYDQDTLFQIQTIYDGGARFEMSEATAKDLESGQLVKVWGDTTGESLKADQICIVKVKS